jgi:hypothetical protein
LERPAAGRGRRRKAGNENHGLSVGYQDLAVRAYPDKGTRLLDFRSRVPLSG